ncbi:MAG: hypothetical protein ACOH13_10550, partial [Flavobacteriales bacterium]
MRTKPYLILCLLLLQAMTVHAQRMEEILPQLDKEKSDSARFYLGFSGLTISETNPVLDMHNA